MEIRIFLLGNRDAGKSSSGNTLLGWKSFHTAPSSQGVTQAWSMSSSTVDGHKIFVVDTPGWTDFSQTENETIQKIVSCIEISDSGSDVLLFVLPIGSFTKEEIDTAKQILEVFGEEAIKHTVVLFTKGDDLEGKTIEEYLEDAHPGLKNVIRMCGGRYHVFNNRDKDNQEQVPTLLKKIKDMVERNKGKRYRKTLFQEMEEEREEKIIPKEIVAEEYRAEMKDSADESADADINREQEEGKIIKGIESEKVKEKEITSYLQHRQEEGQTAIIKLNQNTNPNNSHEEDKYTVHTAKYPSKKYHLEKFQGRKSQGGMPFQQNARTEAHSKELHKMEFKWQKTEAELQRSIKRLEKIEVTWLKEKGELEKKVRQLRTTLREQKTEFDKVKKELQLQQVKVETFEKLRQKSQRQKEELEKLRRENDENREKMKQRNLALLKHLEELERAIRLNKGTDLKSSLQASLSQVKKNVLHPKMSIRGNH
ncbi:GTPase IMAP family member 7-like [Hoplias malabaricus]|uniref:GTPase IMAP family member 7-like n=1 Tax=Hoplias malabaricus TaxID=27720 RepID=UPI00346189F2